MTFADTLIEGIAGAATIAISVLLIRLALDGQRRRYPWFFAWLLALYIEAFVSFIDTSLSLPLQRSIWVFTRLAVTAVEFGLMVSLLGKWTAGSVRIGAMSRRRLSLVLISVSAATALGTVPVGDFSGVLSGIMGRAIIFNRAVNTGCSVFLILLLALFRKLRIPAVPSLRRLTVGMAAYVTGTGVSYFVLAERQFLAGNMMMPSVALLSMAYWFVSLRPSAQVRAESAHAKANSGREELSECQVMRSSPMGRF